MTVPRKAQKSPTRETGNKSKPKRSGMMNPQTLAGLEPGQMAADPAPRGAGKLTAWKMASGNVMFHYRYTRPNGTRDRLPIGAFDPTGRLGLTLKDARDKAGELAKRYNSGDRDLRAAIEAEEAAKSAAKQAEGQADEARKAEAAATLGALTTAYADALEKQGKASARAVRSSLTKNVKDAHPKLWAKPAAKIDADDVLELIETLTTAGSPREAAKLRSYIRAAYAAAINARTKPGALPALRKLKLQTNPARDVGTVAGSTRTRDRALSVAELRAYWNRISALPEPARSALRFHVLTGGQRIEQLARATTADIDSDAHAILLLDPKGRRSEPRRHWVPLLPDAEECIEVMQKNRMGAFVWSVNGGESPVSESTLRDHFKSVSDAMLEAEEIAEKFTPGDIRRTVETRLAAKGVTLEVRAQLQSHGLGGVQARHYDRHDYADEKRAALEILREIVTSKPATVTKIGAKRNDTGH